MTQTPKPKKEKTQNKRKNFFLETLSLASHPWEKLNTPNAVIPSTFLPLSQTYKMSSTMRLFINDNRISTAVKTKSGSILQVYPAKLTFSDEVAWQNYWHEAMKPKITLRISYPEDVEEKKAAPAPAPAPVRKSKRSKKTYPASEVIFNTLAQRPAPVAAVAPKPKKASLSDWNVKNQRDFTFTVPAGTYYIGDLCYALSDDIYDNVFGGTCYESGVYEEKGTNRVFALSATAYGDGEYPSSDGKKFSVDAGIIGICSASLMEKSGRGGHIYTFETPVECHFKMGRFTFFWARYNSLVIDTTGDDDAY